MAKQSETVRHATAALAGFVVVRRTRSEHGDYTGWWFDHNGVWVGAYRTRREALDDVFNWYLEERKL